jgi:hypothetical protein
MGRDEETHVMRRVSDARSPNREPPAAGARGVPRAVVVILAVLATAAVVLAVVVPPLVDRARDGEPSAAASPSVDPGATVVVPSLIGRSTLDAIEAARRAGLDWTLYCDQDAERPEGVVDQEPPAGTEVARGSPFSLYSARIADCG